MKYYIGIYIGGTNLRAALFYEDFTLIDKFEVNNDANVAALSEAIIGAGMLAKKYRE